MHFTIKKLKGTDAELAKQLFWFYQVDDEVAEPLIPSNEYLKKLLTKNDFHVLVALQNDKLIGGLTAFELPMYKEEVNEMFLYEIAVEQEYRKMGVAKALIENLKNICRDKGIKGMYVGTSTDNIPAMRLYKATGGEADEKIAWFVYEI
jgi:aminoglycoside 3-N-acetyltransferase I